MRVNLEEYKMFRGNVKDIKSLGGNVKELKCLGLILKSIVSLGCIVKMSKVWGDYGLVSIIKGRILSQPYNKTNT